MSDIPTTTKERLYALATGTNPNPVAPKTDTPATRRIDQDMANTIVEMKAWLRRHHQNDFITAINYLEIERAGLYRAVKFAESTLAAERASRVQAEELLLTVDGTLCACRYSPSPKDCNCDIHAAHRLIAEVLK